MKVGELAPGLAFIDVALPVSGFNRLIDIYVLKAERIALIDVGPSSSLPNLWRGLQQLQITPEKIYYIFVTHVHLDHSGGIGEVLKRMPNATVIVHSRGKYHLAEPEKLWAGSCKTLKGIALEYGHPEPVPENRMIAASEGMTVDLGSIQIETFFTPGHAPHHLSFYDGKTGRLFAGEAAGVYLDDIDMVRPATVAPFHLQQSLDSIDKLMRLNPRSLYYSHFGNVSNAVDRLRRYKEQLLLWRNVIAEHLEDAGDWERIFEELKQKDKTLGRIDSLAENERERELYFARGNIAGYINYLQAASKDSE